MNFETIRAEIDYHKKKIKMHFDFDFDFDVI